jgi:putative transposase
MSKRIGNLDFDTASHSVYHLAVHIVFCVKFRRHILNPDISGFLFGIIQEESIKINCQILEINGEDDHIHFLLKYNPTDKLSDIVAVLKAKSASAVINRFGCFFWAKHKRTLWSSGYFLCSVGGATLDVLKLYIQSQSLPA